MAKKVFFLCILTLLSFLAYQNWDIIFSESQHIFYSFQYISLSPNQSGSLIEKRVISSSFLKKPMKLNVYLPKDYYSQSHVKYPVLYLLHGYPGTENDWLINTNLQKRLDEKIKSLKIPPIIVVFPDMNGPTIRDSQYLNAIKIDQKMESYFVNELIPFVDKNYKTIKSRNNRAIGGLSSGGYGALYIGLKYNNFFSYIFSHSGYMTNNEPVLRYLVGNSFNIREKYSPLFFVDKIKLQNPIFIYFDIGKNDNKDFIKNNYAFNEKLTNLHIPYDFKITEGSHGWGVWSKNIDNSLNYIYKIENN